MFFYFSYTAIILCMVSSLPLDFYIYYTQLVLFFFISLNVSRFKIFRIYTRLWIWVCIFVRAQVYAGDNHLYDWTSNQAESMHVIMTPTWISLLMNRLFHWNLWILQVFPKVSWGFSSSFQVIIKHNRIRMQAFCELRDLLISQDSFEVLL